MSDLDNATLPLTEAAARVGKTPRMLRYRIARGDLAATRVPYRGEMHTYMVDVESLMAATWRNQKPAAPKAPKQKVFGSYSKGLLPDQTRRQLTYPEQLADGICQGMDTEMFFAEDMESVAKAKAVCQDCPVMRDCRDWARLREEFGTYGGETPRERAAWRRRQAIRLQASAVIK